MPDALSPLTQPELLALALEATRRGDAGHALSYLKEAANRPDASAHALFMLGSEYAQLGLIDDAKASLARAVELGPEFPLARFQYGLLHMTNGDAVTAQAVWAPLATLEAPHPQAYLASFQRGLSHLASDNFNACVQALREGLALNRDNEPLNVDMRGVIDNIARLADQHGAAAASPAVQVDVDVEPGHLFISAYAQRGKPH